MSIGRCYSFMTLTVLSVLFPQGKPQALYQRSLAIMKKGLGHFLATMTVAVVLRVFAVWDEYVVSLLLLLSWVTLGIVLSYPVFWSSPLPCRTGNYWGSFADREVSRLQHKLHKKN